MAVRSTMRLAGCENWTEIAQISNKVVYTTGECHALFSAFALSGMDDMQIGGMTEMSNELANRNEKSYCFWKLGVFALPGV